MRTTFTGENEGFLDTRTDSAQILRESDTQAMKFPQTIEFRGFKVKIYGKTPENPCYRLDYRSAGKRHQQQFQKYRAALKKAKVIVRDMAKGSHASSLTASQSRDALVALEYIQNFYTDTGKKISLSSAVSEYTQLAKKVLPRSPSEAVDGFLRTVITLKRKDILEAVKEFIQVDAPRTKSTNGERSQLSSKYAYNRKLQLHRFAGAFPNAGVGDLTKEHLDAFIGRLAEIKTASRNKRLTASSPKSRNHYRASIRQFLGWCVRKDYLISTHRLLEADAMRMEHVISNAPHFYTNEEFAWLLKNADESLHPIIAIGGLAGLRTSELLQLDWADVWRRDGHIEITARIAKGRFRRLVEFSPALVTALEPFRNMITGRLWKSHEITFQQKFSALFQKAKFERKTNGLRHAYCTYHYALYASEEKTSQQSGNSPTLIHSNYKGFATKGEAEKWFGIKPDTK